MIDILTSGLVLAGALVALVGSVGLVRFPDVYCRLHAGGITTSLGVPIILFASVIYFSDDSASLSLKGLLAIVFLFLTAPVATHMIGLSAYRSGVPLHHVSILDETGILACSEDDGASATHTTKPRVGMPAANLEARTEVVGHSEL